VQPLTLKDKLISLRVVKGSSEDYISPGGSFRGESRLSGGSCLSPFRKAKLEVNVFRKVIMEKGNYVLGPEEQSVVTK
jgi:hypothetical protein